MGTHSSKQVFLIHIIIYSKTRPFKNIQINLGLVKLSTLLVGEILNHQQIERIIEFIRYKKID